MTLVMGLLPAKFMNIYRIDLEQIVASVRQVAQAK